MSYHRQYFKEDDEGNLVYFPHSFWGRGYVLVGEAKDRVVRRTAQSAILGLMVMLAFAPLVILGYVLFELTPMQVLWLWLIPLPPLVVAGRITSRRLVVGLPVSELRLTFFDFLIVELDRRQVELLFCLVAGAFLTAIGVLALLAFILNGWKGSGGGVFFAIGAIGLVMSLLAWRARKMLNRARREGRLG
jgi:hypothetical protein